MTPPNADADADANARIAPLTQHAELGEVAAALTRERDAILHAWLEAARLQAFHVGRRERAVADNIPMLFDALVALLQRSAPRWVEPGPPLEDPAILRAAQEHARVRFEQGLQPADVVTEFRLLRQEIGRALRFHLADRAPLSDVLAAELLVHDALDGAISVALDAITTHIEEVREDFLATTLHDVGQPLTAVKGSIGLALRELQHPPLDREQLARTLGRAAAETERLWALLADLADRSRLALGRHDVHLDALDLSALVRAVVERVDPEEARRVVIVDAVHPMTVRGDARLLARVLDNLLSNALKYSAPLGRVTVALAREADRAQVAVQDTGIGLTADELEGLFRRYARAGSAVARGVPGDGLGLYLSRGIVEAHGGRLWLESPGRDQGTTAHLVLPTAPIDASDVPLSLTAQPGARGPSN